MHVLLVEPDYYTRYPPLGLLKLASYHKSKGDSVELVRGNTIPARTPHIIYVTSLFTWAWVPVHSAVKYYKMHYPDVPLHLGGVYATLLTDHAELSGADYIHKGIMPEIEDFLPLYELVPEWDGSILFASRGCIRKCGFCAVPKLEGAPKYLKVGIRHLLYPKHTRIVFNDNNILGNNNWKEIFDEVIDIGWKVDFNQGLDARLITDEAAERMGRMKFFPTLRIAYDFVGIGKFVKKAIERLVSNGIDGRTVSNENDEYNRSWGYACIDGGITKIDCDQIKDDPVDVQDHEALQQENAQNCWNDGYEDGKADNPFNKDRDHGCDEYNPDYEQGYNSGCIIDDTDNTCQLKIRGEESYCPFHPDVTACVDFLHNATNKRPASTIGACVGMGDPRPEIICPQENNPEGYCLMTDDPAFCKTIGDICDEGGFVKPEYPYCTK